MSRNLTACMDPLPCKRLHTEIHTLPETGDGLFLALMFRGKAKHMIETRKNEFLQSGAALCCNDLGPMENLVGKINRGFHTAIIQQYGRRAISLRQSRWRPQWRTPLSVVAPYCPWYINRVKFSELGTRLAGQSGINALMADLG